MQYTLNYKFKKPDGTDTVNIDDFNFNSDEIDKKFLEAFAAGNAAMAKATTADSKGDDALNKISVNATKINANTLAINTKFDKAGGAVTGTIITPNGAVGIKLGDDAQLVDVNILNMMGIQGQQDTKLGGLVFGSDKDTNLYRESLDKLKTDDTFCAKNGYEVGDSTTKLLKGTYNTLKIATPYGFVDIGPQNDGFAHYSTDRLSHWFNKDVRVQGDIYAGPLYNQKVWHAGNQGTGSGLDADKLDGKEAAEFALVAHNHTGVYSPVAHNHAGVYAATTQVVELTPSNVAGKFNKTITNPTAIDRLNYEGYFYATRVYNAVYNDYAEYFFKDDNNLEYGDVISINSEGNGYIKSQGAYDKLVVGVYSKEFAQCIGGEGKGDDDQKYASVGMAGRVNVKMVGIVRKGELLSASDIPGVAMVASQYIPGTVIGKALENSDNENVKEVRMLIMNS